MDDLISLAIIFALLAVSGYFAWPVLFPEHYDASVEKRRKRDRDKALEAAVLKASRAAQAEADAKVRS